MITIIGYWEKDWLDPKIEFFMMKQLKHAYKVDRMIMIPKLLSDRTSLDQYDTLEEALDTVDGDLVYLEHTSDSLLQDFKHPENAVYIFGKVGVGHMNREGGVKIRIDTPGKSCLFATNALAITLENRNEHG